MMQTSPSWQARIVAYRVGSDWYTPEAVAFERAKGVRQWENALPYSWEMLIRRHTAGRDVPAWAVMHVDAEIRLREAA